MDQTTNLPREPPRLYSSVFIERALNCARFAVANAIRYKTLRPFGKIKGAGRHSRTYVCTAAQLSQWITGRRRRWAVTPAALECWFDGLIDALKKAGELPSSQQHLEDTPYDDLVWVSNYAHHGGRTQEESHGS